MATRVLAYECKYCGTLKKTRALMDRHELACLRNPKAKTAHVVSTSKITVMAARRARCLVSCALSR